MIASIEEGLPHELPPHLEPYIDYGRMGRDSELSGELYTLETGHQEVHVFWSL